MRRTDISPTARQVSGELQMLRLTCSMGNHPACDGLVPGGPHEGVRCMCECHEGSHK